MKIYCASDLHLGYEYADYDTISAFLEIVRKKADALILCGDIFDLWRYPISKIHKTALPGFKDCVAELRLTAMKVPTTVIPGNHDYNLEKMWPWPKRGKIKISEGFALEGIFYTHGWEFDVQQRRYSWAYGWLVTQFPYLYQKFMKKPVLMGLARNDRITPQIKAVHDEANDFAIRNEYDHIVIGHTHTPGFYNRVVDCGDFVDSCSYLTIEDKKISIEYM